MEETWRRRNLRCLIPHLLFFLMCLRPSSSGDQPQDAQVAESTFGNCTEKIFLPSPYVTWIGFHSITLSWTALNCTDVVYIPQWTGPTLSGVWTHKENVTEPTYTVEDLQPFTLYKFRIWAMISETYTVSPESQFYRTEPFGVPTSPVIESVESDSGVCVDVSWSPPENPRGSIVGYNLNLTSHAHILTLTMAGNVFFTTFYPTLHNTTYRISIAAVNREGQGVAAEANVTTPPQLEQNSVRWVFASRMNSLRKLQEEADLFTAAECLSDRLIMENITGVAVYHNSNLVYFSEGTRIWEKGAGNITDHSNLKLVHSDHAKITALTVDWLYRKLYYVSDGKVRYCKLDDCSHPVDFNLTLDSAPTRIIADPYNGWLFLLLHDGIHRISLPEVSDHTDNLTLVVKTDSVHDFVVSFPNRRLVFYDKGKRTLSAVSLDGLLPVSLYSKINFNVQSVAYEVGLLMLTDGHAVYKQTGNGQVAIFTEFSMDCDIFLSSYGGFGNVRFFGPSSQPYPVPRKPRDLQVLFGSDKATLRWNKPEIQNGSSLSAWQNWTYSVKCSLNGLVISEISHTDATYTTVPDLQSCQSYVLSVWAVSPGGSSHTVMFQGTTLQPEEDPPYIAGATAAEGIWRQQLDSFIFLEMLASSVKDVKDMDWYNNTIFWTNSSGHISWMDVADRSSAPEVLLVSPNMEAHAIAFDWLGQSLYWSCNTNMICRGRLSSPEAEIFLNVNQKINSILIDSPNAAIYWSTETTLEVCRLDGEKCDLLEKLSVFSGTKIAGITADWSESSLYWLVEDGSFLHLYRAHISNKTVHHVLKWSSSTVLNQQLAFYGGRLVWLDVDGKLRIQELNQTASVVMSPSNTLTAFTLLQRTLKPLPDGFVSAPTVIPSAVSKSSIHLKLNELVVKIIWDPSSTEFGTVFYCVELNVYKKQTEKIHSGSHCPLHNRVSEPFKQINEFKPNTKINITITPYTYWGRGDSTFQTLLIPSEDSATETNAEITLSVVISLLIVIIIVIGVIIYFRRRRKKAPETDMETDLATQGSKLEEIRELVGLGNACYAVSALPIHKEIESLPAFPRECLKLQRLLGSGAFGEVYEGVTITEHNASGMPETRVAVKTLQKGASHQEKVDFLKEARLMSQFNHPNILCLLGVCVLNEPHYLILELMEGGDLRSYLRGARATSKNEQLLTLTDLLDISVDVAKGCAYLERLHFVHRDLAARNCLVSGKAYTDPNRVVKIGDFGLARDVYKNDYYRKRGEGLLPVRWMPPESLTDGVFNKYSDVWAFGVLLWETVTLGKQPYPAFSNQEVLHHVNAGGRLTAPAECSQSLYNVMLSCWKKEPRERPSFRSLLWTLEQLRETETSSQDGKTGRVNPAYQEDENEEISRGVDTDEGLGSGLTHVISNEGLNYLMYHADDLGDTNSSSSSRTESSSHTEDR
ncbi:hypothetical protein PGIGA_G00020940 [Pangasianodon gigas]|uniref:Uncharacterized protein n=1 Tax=Pangasianodon gigas TaxID=30993 RepID=A0ACC5WWA8_PANGG|nr:hypothetical protein [Pangasianodon gigas]